MLLDGTLHDVAADAHGASSDLTFANAQTLFHHLDRVGVARGGRSSGRLRRRPGHRGGRACTHRGGRAGHAGAGRAGAGRDAVRDRRLVHGIVCRRRSGPVHGRAGRRRHAGHTLVVVACLAPFFELGVEVNRVAAFQRVDDRLAVRAARRGDDDHGVALADGMAVGVRLVVWHEQALDGAPHALVAGLVVHAARHHVAGLVHHLDGVAVHAGVDQQVAGLVGLRHRLI